MIPNHENDGAPAARAADRARARAAGLRARRPAEARAACRRRQQARLGAGDRADRHDRPAAVPAGRPQGGGRVSTAIRCESLVKRYGRVTALDGLDLEVPAGSLFGLLGPNGAGKTTTIRLLTGLDWPTAGRATVAGLDPTRRRPTPARLTGHQPQQQRLCG